jgi:hypothetical protein
MRFLQFKTAVPVFHPTIANAFSSDFIEWTRRVLVLLGEPGLACRSLNGPLP